MTDPVQHLLDDVRDFAPRAAARAAEIEAAGRMPLDLVEELRALGIFRMFVPGSHGGLDVDLVSSLRVFEALGVADAATSWIAMIGSHAAVLPALLPRATYDAIYAHGPDVAWACSLVPGGTAEIAEGGYRVSGRWPFASGCQHAQWLFAFCLITRDGKPIDSPSPGPPPILGVALPASAWTIEDTWRAEGLKGTGSHHVSLQDVLVREAQTFPVFGAAPCVPGPIYAAALALLPFHFGAVALGVAEGAVQDLAALARSGKRYGHTDQDLKDSAVFHHELGRAAADVRAARAFLYAEAESHWTAALAGRLDDAAAVDGGQALAWIAAACARAVDACYTLGGSSVVYDSSPLQRRLRDIHAITQHATLNPRMYGFAGAVLSGHPARDPMG